MPQTGAQQPRNAGVSGGEKDTQQAANQTEAAAAPARARQQEAQQFVDVSPNSPPEGVQLVDPRMENESVPSYEDEEQEFLFGQTDRPDEPANFGVTTQRAQPPKNVYRYLSSLAEAAEDPDAPEQVHALIRVLNDLLTDDEPGLNFDDSALLDPSQVEFRPSATLGTGPQRRGQMERPLSAEDGEPARENRVPPVGSDL
jgi:hypothetical protein